MSLIEKPIYVYTYILTYEMIGLSVAFIRSWLPQPSSGADSSCGTERQGTVSGIQVCLPAGPDPQHHCVNVAGKEGKDQRELHKGGHIGLHSKGVYL